MQRHWAVKCLLEILKSFFFSLLHLIEKKTLFSFSFSIFLPFSFSNSTPLDGVMFGTRPEAGIMCDLNPCKGREAKIPLEGIIGEEAVETGPLVQSVGSPLVSRMKLLPQQRELVQLRSRWNAIHALLGEG